MERTTGHGFSTPGIKVAALDAATGELVWDFDPFEGEKAKFVNRGVTYKIESKQYVVIPATRGSRVGTNSSDAFITFSLPEENGG